uniref:Cilia and flagella associated protein 161 n=1 Tax=Athene cunicularia TaxID=194338 RepID=A0A663N6X5_ATHCN
AAMAAYRPGVLIGNWNEEAYLEEVGEELGPSPVSGSRAASPGSSPHGIHLSVSKDGFVHFGDTVILLNPPNKSPVENYPGACGSLTLAVDLDEISIYSVESLQVPCGVSAVKSVDPTGRNTFCILRFGTLFCVVFNYYFSFQYLANSEIIITHCHTNRSLAVPRNFWTRSYFGKEYEVVCHTYLDSHKAEEDKNYWKIVTGDPGDEDGTMIERPNPHPKCQSRKRVRDTVSLSSKKKIVFCVYT